MTYLVIFVASYYLARSWCSLMEWLADGGEA